MTQQIRIDQTLVQVRWVQGKPGQAVRISFVPGSTTLQVRTATGGPTHEAEVFIQQKKRWILKTVNRISGNNDTLTTFVSQLEDGKVLQLGIWQPVVWETEGTQTCWWATDGSLHLAGFDKQSASLILAAQKTLAKNYLIAKTWEWAKRTGHDTELNRVSIKEQKTRWGSCSTKRNINLNWRLILMPEATLEYVIIHELMHLRHMNHSRDFWREVAHFCPDYKSHEHILKQHTWCLQFNLK